jgi:hypothetical protein
VECEAGDQDRDEWGYCSICKLRPLDERFPAEFRAWVENLKRLYLWHKAGYSLDSEGLSFEEWGALSYITRHYELKDLQAIMPTAGTSSEK